MFESCRDHHLFSPYYTWTGPADGVGAIFQSCKTAIPDILQEAARAVG